MLQFEGAGRCAFVVLWMGLGFAFRLDANSYLLVGLPITGVFQRFVARRRLTDVWIRDAVAPAAAHVLIDAVRNALFGTF